MEVVRLAGKYTYKSDVLFFHCQPPVPPAVALSPFPQPVVFPSFCGKPPSTSGLIQVHCPEWFLVLNPAASPGWQNKRMALPITKAGVGVEGKSL